MGLNESLDGVSKSLANILEQLKGIEKVQSNINTAGAPNIGASGSTAGSPMGMPTPRFSNVAKPTVSSSGTSSATPGQVAPTNPGNLGMPRATFSTPPPPPGRGLGGITQASSGGGGGMPMGNNAETSSSMPGFARAAALGTAAAVTYGYAVTPGVADVYAHQQMKFQNSFFGGGSYKYNDNYYRRTRSMFGDLQTDPFAMMTAANIATMTGQGMGTGNFNRMMRETAVTSTIFGQDTATAATAQASMNSGSMAGRLSQYGIFVSDLSTGNSQGFGHLVDEIWRIHYGSPTRKIPYESVAASIRGGYIGSFLNRTFSDAPELKDQLIKALLLKAKNQGQSYDYLDLGAYQGSARNMTGRKGSKSAMGAFVDMGGVPENQPGLTNQALQSSRGNTMDSTANATLSGYRTSAYTAVNINELVESITSSGNGLVNFLLSLKGALEGFQSIGELSPILGLFTGLFGGMLKSGGGSINAAKGTSTSDSIRANLSKGEYVINARAVQMVGRQQLDEINSLGHPFGSGFASPAKSFSRGGTTLDGWPALSPDDPQMQTFTVPGVKGSYLLRKDYAPMLLKVIQAYNQNVRKIDEGYGYRSGDSYYGGGLTNHMAGVAFDVDYDTYWGYPGSAIDPTPAQMTAIRNILAANPGIEWGGDWDKPKWYDPMHFEITDPSVKATGGGSIPAADKPARTGESSSTGKAAPSMKMDALLGTISGGSSALKPSTASLGGFTGGSKGLRLGLGTKFSWIGAPLYGTTASGSLGNAGSNSTTTDAKSGGKGRDSKNVAPTNDVGSGNGPEWLYDYLVSKGLRGQDLHLAWVLGMRESHATPSKTTNDSMDWDWDSSGEPNYDVGLFQVNNVNLAGVKKKFGNSANMKTMLDVNKNYEMLMYMSQNLTSLRAWALSPDGRSFDWSMYGGKPDWGSTTESEHALYWDQYNRYNKQNYSEGAYRTHEGLAKLHEGEMVLPATVAEEFRKVMREASSPGTSGGQQVNITLKIEKASDEEAERFAKKVKQYLDNSNWETSLRSR